MKMKDSYIIIEHAFMKEDEELNSIRTLEKYKNIFC